MVVVLYAWNVALGNGARRRTRPPGGDSDGDHQRAPPFMRILLRRVTRVGARADANSSSLPASLRSSSPSVSPSSTATDSGFEPLHYASARDVDVDIANPAPTAHSASSEVPAYTAQRTI
jgi:hypothetical protein